MNALATPARPLKRLPPGKPTELIARISLEMYHAMIAEGILTDDDPIELLEGWMVVKMSKNPPHSSTTELLRYALQALLLAGWHIRSQEPVSCPLDDSEPEPDLTIVKGEPRDFRQRHPGPPDVALVIEVADSTLERDRDTKSRIYARSSLSEYWIVNLVERQFEVYTDPSGPEVDAKYRRCQIYKLGDEAPVVIDGQEVGRIAVAAILGEPMTK